ncbi:hypothetical protein ACTRW9_03340 [Nitrospina sp. 32_T5]|uniref:hypothetical protein n=1 Tax=unclassified Nitrospina TaxID=2638683 RepID=UPI003F9D6D3A
MVHRTNRDGLSIENPNRNTPAMDYTRFYRPLVQFLVYAYALNAFTFVYADPDLFGHITYGGEIWNSGQIPLTDPYAYTSKGPWINHEWLMEVVFYLLYDAWGSSGLLMFRLVLGLSIIHILSDLYLSRSNNLLAYAFHFILLTHVLAFGFAMRPQLATYFFLPVLLYLVYDFFDGNRSALVLIPPVFVLWVNCHGGVVAGLGIFSMIVAVETIRNALTGGSNWKYLLAAWVGSCLAMLVNPYGIDLLTFFLKTIPQARDVTEWYALNLFDASHLHFKILVLLFGATLLTPVPKRWWEVAIILFGVYFGIKHVRHTVLTGLLMTPYLPLQLAAIMDRIRSRTSFSPVLPRLAHALLAVIIIAFAAFQVNVQAFKLKRTGFELKVDPGYFPIHAVRFLKENRIHGNILVPTNWGQYVIFHLPHSKVSSDGRYWTVYEPKLVRQNMVFHKGWQGWQYFLKFYPHDLILTGKENRELEKTPGWVKIFEGPRARVFVRTGLPWHSAYYKHRNQILKYNPDPASLRFP